MGLHSCLLPCSLCPSQLPVLRDYTPFSGLLWGVDSLAFDLHGGSTYLFFRHGLVGFLVLSRKCVCVCICVQECLAIFSPSYIVTFQPLADGVISYVCQAICHLQSALHLFSHVTPPPPPCGGLFCCCVPILQLRILRPREVAQGHTVAESGFKPRFLIKFCPCSLPLSWHLFLARDPEENELG